MRRTFCWVLVLLACSALAAAEPAELRWQFRKGQTFKYALKHREVRTVELADQKFETTTTAEYEWQWTVQDVDDEGTADLTHRFTAVRVESMGKDFDFRYDSGQGNSSPNDYYKKLIHLYDQVRFGEYKARLRRDGRAAVTGFDKLLGEIGADASLLDFHALNLRDDTFAWYLQQALGVLPGKAVAAGEKWESATDLKIAPFGQLTGKTQYVLEKADVKFTGAAALEMDTKWLGQPLVGTLKVTKLTGTLKFDPKAQAVQAGAAQAELSGELRLGNETNPARMKITFQHTLELRTLP